MKSELSKNRHFLMGIAMLAIVFFHHGWQVIPLFTGITSRFGLWGVDIFLFLSGFGCVYALNKYSTSVFWRRRVNRLLPTCMIVGVLTYMCNFLVDAEQSVTFLPVRLLSLHRWYIQTIVICYALCPLAYVILKKYKAAGLIALCVVAVIIEWNIPEMEIYRIRWAFGRMPVFLIGMYVAVFDLRLTKFQYILSALCLLLAALIRCGGGYYVFQWTYFLAAAMPFVCETLCKLRNVCIKLHIYRFFEILGIYSLEIYLIHEYTYWALDMAEVPLWSKYIFFIIIVATLCYLVKLTSGYISKILRLAQ